MVGFPEAANGRRQDSAGWSASANPERRAVIVPIADRKAIARLTEATSMFIRLTLYGIVALSSMVFGLGADLVVSGVLVF
jgi:hypothetical protein